MKRLPLILALALLLSACAASPAETTLPVQTAPAAADSSELTLPAETTSPFTDALTPETAAVLLNADAEHNWLARSLGCLYAHPHELDLETMFYLGVDHPGSWDDISEESRQVLLNAGFLTEMDIQIMPTEKLESALQETFGVSLNFVSIPDSWCYIEAEDAFCSNHNDAYFPGLPSISEVTDDGLYITIHYTIDGVWIRETGEFPDTAPMALCLIRNDDGTLHAVSNLLRTEE